MSLVIPYKGNIKEIPVLELLHSIFENNETGYLNLDGNGYVLGIHFEKGKIKNINSNYIVNLNLLSILLREGYISEEIYDKVKSKINIIDKKIGEFLLSNGTITEEQLKKALSIQAEEKLIKALEVCEGEFSFERLPDIETSNSEQLLDHNFAIMKGIEKSIGVGYLRKFIRNEEENLIILNENPIDVTNFTYLKANEIRFVQSLKNGMYLKQVIENSKISLTRTYQIIVFLNTIGKISFSIPKESKNKKRRFLDIKEISSKDIKSDYSFLGISPKENNKQKIDNDDYESDFSIVPNKSKKSQKRRYTKEEVLKLCKKGEELEDADLSNMDLSNIDLSKAYLAGVNFQNSNLRNSNLSYANLMKANFSNANLYNANLSFANLEMANFYKAVLIKANLKGTNIEKAFLEFAKID